MNVSTHGQLASFIWKICNLLRGPYKRNEYRKVILPLTVLRRFDCVLAGTKQAVLDADKQHAHQPDTVRRQLLEAASGRPFYNTSRLDFERLLDDPNLLAQNLNAYIRGFSENVQEVIDRFGFADQIARMDERNLLFEVIKAFAGVDLSPQRVDNMQMGYVFEELIRVGAEQSNEEAGEHFTPREVIRLMVSLLLTPEPDLGKSHVYKTIYDPACGTGGMLSVTEDHLLEHNREARPILYGQDINDEAWAVCKVRHDAQRAGRGEHHPWGHVHPTTASIYARTGSAGPSTTCSQIHPSVWNGNSSSSTSSRSATPSATTDASDRGCLASTMGRCCSCCTCSPRCSPLKTADGSGSAWRAVAAP